MFKPLTAPSLAIAILLFTNISHKITKMNILTSQILKLFYPLLDRILHQPI